MSTYEYLQLLDELSTTDCIIPINITSTLLDYVRPIYRSEHEEKFIEPMFWIGLYIACASLVCILAMVTDLLHGIRRGKLWFPCKYFRINSAFLAIISVAMKLPVDLSGSMPGDVDQVAKLGSMAFMCTMMANLLPCLSTMDNNALWSNITALCLLIITIVVNVCIQIQTGVVSNETAAVWKAIYGSYEVNINTDRNIILASIYVASLLWLLMVHVCSCLAILKSKKIIESKYQQGHDRALKDIKQSSGELLTELQNHVKNHWIMAGSGSPQFITACFGTTSATGVICVFVTILHTLTMFGSIDAIMKKDCGSDYGQSTIAIVIVQFIGVVIGTIAPISRCFAALSFKMSLKIISNDFKVFKLESYWTSMLYDWKRASLKLPFRSHGLNVVMETSKKLILSFCIEFQEGFVVVCKILALIPFVFMICGVYCFRCLKWLFNSSLKRFCSLEEETNFLERNKGLRPYVLQLEDEKELAKRTLEGLSKSVNQLIQNGENSKANDNLKKLIEPNAASGFHGVAKFDNVDECDMQHFPSLLLKGEHQNCWSLPVVTLTTIAVSLPGNQREEVDKLLKGVKEGLLYVTLVEENLNPTNDFVSVQKAAKSLWKEVDIDHKWLGYKLPDPSSQVKTTRQIVEWFRDTSGKMKTPREIVEWFRDTSEKIVFEEVATRNDDSKGKSMCANSMYRITKTILLSTNSANNDVEASQKELFDNLSSMIADIMAACLTNLPQVIAMKCHTAAIEIREASVKDAALLLGEYKKIIEALQRRGIPRMNDPSDLPFIHKWRAYLRNP